MIEKETRSTEISNFNFKAIFKMLCKKASHMHLRILFRREISWILPTCVMKNNFFLRYKINQCRYKKKIYPCQPAPIDCTKRGDLAKPVRT